MSFVCFVFAVGYIFLFIPFSVTKGTMVYFITVYLTLWLGCNQLMIRQSLSLFVIGMLITLNGRSQSLLLIDMCEMHFIFAIWQVVISWGALPLTLLLID